MNRKISFSLRLGDSQIPGLISRYHATNSSNVALDANCLAAGQRIRNGEFSKEVLRIIYRWKMESRKYLGQEQKYFDKNSDEDVSRALSRAIEAVTAHDTERAFGELQSLKGIAIAVASAILMAIFPKQFTVIDVMTFRALGVPEKTPLTVQLYIQYLAYCDVQARRLGLCLRDMDRALWQWGHENPQ
jgi:hypothetical protein